jgi:hypothetical protein
MFFVQVGILDYVISIHSFIEINNAFKVMKHFFHFWFNRKHRNEFNCCRAHLKI